MEKLVIQAEEGILVLSKTRSTYINCYGMSYNLPFDGEHFTVGRYRLSFDPNREPALIIYKWNLNSRTIKAVCEVSWGADNSKEVRGDEGQLYQLMELLFCLSVPVGNTIPDPEEGEGEQDYILFANYNL